MTSTDKTARILSLNNIKPPVAGRCGFFVKRKQRYCKMIPAKGNKYCAEHLSEDTEMNSNNKRKRILCPLDPKHSVFEDKLAKHLKKCNVTLKTHVPYYKHNINLKVQEDASEGNIPLYKLPTAELRELIKKIKKCYHDIAGDSVIKETFSSHPVLHEEMKTPGLGAGVKKHLLQQASLVDILSNKDVLRDDMIIIEFGAGRGALSHWIQKAMTGERNKFLLVDRQHNRNKLDCYHKGENQGPDFERLNIDIQHLNLSCVTSLTDNEMNITAVGKHLCGGATDLSLRCLFEAEESRSSAQATEQPSKKPKKDPITSRVQAVLFALCCYHRCQWDTYVGNETLMEMSFTPLQFQRLTKMAAWATCGFERRKDAEGGHHTEEGKTLRTTEANDHGEDTTKECADNGHKTVKSQDTDSKLHIELCMTTSEQKEVGIMCKRIIDHGRLQYIRCRGYNAELIKYVRDDVTPENIALLVT